MEKGDASSGEHRRSPGGGTTGARSGHRPISGAGEMLRDTRRNVGVRPSVSRKSKAMKNIHEGF